jgi:hypothetical protein
MTTPKTYSFTLTLGGIPEVPEGVPYEEFVEQMAGLTNDACNRLFEAGCDDASLSGRGRVHFLHFDRAAESLGKAIGSAVQNVEKAGYKVARVEVEEAATAG